MRFEPIRAEERSGCENLPILNSQRLAEFFTEKTRTNTHRHVVARDAIDWQKGKKVRLPQMQPSPSRFACEQIAASWWKQGAELSEFGGFEMMEKQVRDHDLSI